MMTDVLPCNKIPTNHGIVQLHESRNLAPCWPKNVADFQRLFWLKRDGILVAVMLPI